MMDKAKALELIKQLEQHQQSQIECLRALFDLDGQTEAEEILKDEVQDKTLDTDEGTGEILKNTEISSNSAISSASVLDSPSQENRVHIPDEWAMPWSNALLRQRIEEREEHLGPKDLAAKFIPVNALRDLAHYTVVDYSDDTGKPAFYIIDSDRHGQITLDTRTCFRGVDAAANTSEALRTLSEPVQSFICPESAYSDTS
ncbi:MAG: hypothetical protein Q9208_003139 [Pyrenodesmia sp. 3 TL-2023]